jgi:hypothetical protein
MRERIEIALLYAAILTVALLAGLAVDAVMLIVL